MQVTVNQETEDGSNVVASADGSLPLGGNVQLAVDIGPSEAPEVPWVYEEVVDHADIHALHDEGQAEQHAVDGGGPVPLEELLAREERLGFSGGDGSVDELDLGIVRAILAVVGGAGLDLGVVLDGHGVVGDGFWQDGRGSWRARGVDAGERERGRKRVWDERETWRKYARRAAGCQ